MTSSYSLSSDVELIQDEPVYQGFFSLRKLRLKHRRFAGDWTSEMSRELLVRGQAVGLLAYDPRLDQVVMIEQFRIGALDDAQSPWLLELIAGILEEGEAPQEVARREAWEEAGLKVNELEELFTYYASPGGSDERVTLYCALVDASQLGGIYGLADEHEDIRVLVKSREAAYHEACQGRAANAMSLIALQWLQSHYERLQLSVRP